MRKSALCFFLLLGLRAFPQNSRVDFANIEEAAPQRTSITETFRSHLKTSLGFLPVITIDHLYMKHDFAFLAGKLRNNGGKEIDFARIDLSKQKTAFPFDGQETRALLKRKGGGWELLEWIVSPHAAYCACWWAEHNAPKELFDFTDYCR